MKNLLAQLLVFVAAAQCSQHSQKWKIICWKENKRSVAHWVHNVHIYVNRFSMFFYTEQYCCPSGMQESIPVSILPGVDCFAARMMSWVSIFTQLRFLQGIWWLWDSDSEHWWRIPRKGRKSTKPRGWHQYTAPTCIATSFLTKPIKDSRSCRLRDLFVCVPLNSEIFVPQKITFGPTLDDPCQMPSPNSPDPPSTDQWLARWCAEPKQSIQVACSEVCQRQVVPNRKQNCPVQEFAMILLKDGSKSHMVLSCFPKWKNVYCY